MIPDKPLHKSKKAIVLGIALLNLNAIFIASALKPDLPIAIVTQMITAILFLVGIYTGVQGGIDMVQSNKLDVVKSETDTTNTTITKKYEYRMEYDDSKK
jgi:hypothetical protein